MIQFSKKIKLLFLFAIFFIAPNFSHAAVIFEDNFDAQADWRNLTMLQQCNQSSCVQAPPQGWTYWMVDESWTPTDPSRIIDGSHPTLNIDATNHYGVSGKAYTHWNELNKGERQGNGFGNDGVLSKLFDQDYPELWFQVHIKFQPGYALDTINQSIIKLFRFSHYDRAGSFYSFFEGGTHAPIYVFDNIQNESGHQYSTAVRCDPQITDYACPGNTVLYQRYIGSPTFAQKLGDGNWHTLKWHAKLNSAYDVKDGELDFWVDGVHEQHLTDRNWIRTGGDLFAGWNTVMVGGNNANNIFGINDNYATAYRADAEQWYSIDEVVVSDTAIPDGYIIGGDALAPSAPTGLGVL